MLDRLNSDRFEQRQTCTIRLYGNKSQLNAIVSNLDEIKKAINDFSKLSKVYSMQITIANEKYNIRTGFPIHTISKTSAEFLIADKITTPREISKEKPNVELTPIILLPEDLDAPSIKTYSTTHDNVTLNKWSGKRTFTTKETQGWKKLNSNDIVVDSNLNQIFPEKTSKLPDALVELLQHVR